MINLSLITLFTACLKNWSETIEEFLKMICGQGSDSHTISFYCGENKNSKEEEKLCVKIL